MVVATRIWTGAAADNNFGTATNWIPNGAPAAGDTLYIPNTTTGTSANITAGLDYHATALAGVHFDDGFTGTVASSAAYLQLNCTSFTYASGGQAYIDLNTSAIGPQILNTASGSVSAPGLFLKGSALTNVVINGGSVGFAGLDLDTATCSTIRVNGQGSQLYIGPGAAVVGLELGNGTICTYWVVAAVPTLIDAYGGTLTTYGSAAIVTITQIAGTVFSNSTGTISTYNLNGGIADFTKSGVVRTVSTLKQNFGAQLLYDPTVLTITTRSGPDYPTRFVSSLI